MQNNTAKPYSSTTPTTDCTNPNDCIKAPNTPTTESHNDLPAWATTLIQVFSLLAGIVYHTAFVGGPWQATPGKRLMGCIMVTKDGKRLSYAHALGRHFACALSAITLCIGYMLAGWTREKTALHDMICGTRVIRVKTKNEVLGL